MKKFLVLVLTVAVLASSFVLPSMAATEPKDIGGFDFYSITFHYSEPTVVGYKIEKVEEEVNGKKKKVDKYVFADAVDSYTVYVKETKENQVLSQQSESVIKTANNAVTNFFAVEASDMGIGANELMYSKYPTAGAYVTQIQDKTAIMLKDSSNIAGLGDFYDQTGKVNPNLVVENGYFIDAVTGNKIDDNGFVIDANNLWHEESGIRVEAFIEDAEGKLVWIPYEKRSVDGKALENSKVNGEYLVEKGVLPAFPEFDANVDYNEDGNAGTTKSKSADKKAWQAKKDSYESAFVQLYRIKTDTDGNGKYSKAELAAADDLTKTFTQDDIEVFVNAMGVSSFNRGTPVAGVAKTKSTIKSITIEIDALGTQLYSDVAQDPQQKNTIVLSTGSVLENVKFAEDVVAKDSTKYNNVGTVVGTAKAVTTKTAMDLKKDAAITAKSVNVEATADTLAAIKNGVELYFNFFVETLQPTDGVNIADTYKDALAPVTVYKLEESDIPSIEVAEEDDGGLGLGLIIGIVAGAVVLIAVVVIIIVVVSKKKKKAAPVAEETPAEEIPAEETAEVAEETTEE
ncbi:MAG: hypothetical protein E7384_05120 [Ruminococcaceae bacterium]|nr:hypothetical protein [Oscillospiraceae bacterium]